MPNTVVDEIVTALEHELITKEVASKLAFNYLQGQCLVVVNQEELSAFTFIGSPSLSEQSPPLVDA